MDVNKKHKESKKNKKDVKIKSMRTIVQGKNHIYSRRQNDQETEWLFSQEKGEAQLPYQSSVILRQKD